MEALREMTRNARIAFLCHEVNKTYCESIGDYSQPSWIDAPQWQKGSALNGVTNAIENYLSTGEWLTPQQSHENWLKHKESDGWVYGDVKNPDKKEHPCMKPYNELPKEQQAKDALFMTVVKRFVLFS